MKIIDENIFEHEKEHIVVFLMNALGFDDKEAILLNKQYPLSYKAWYCYCKNHIFEDLIGQAFIFENNPNQYVSVLFGKDGNGLNQGAFKSALRQLSEYAKSKGLSIAVPYKIGCDENNKWKDIKQIIATNCRTVPVYIFKRGKHVKK